MIKKKKKKIEPTDWVNSMVVVPKPNGKVRNCIDPRDLNKVVLKEHYPMKTIEDISLEIPEAKVFFETECCFRILANKIVQKARSSVPFRRLPYGLKSAGDVYQGSVSNVIQDMDPSISWTTFRLHPSISRTTFETDLC